MLQPVPSSRNSDAANGQAVKLAKHLLIWLASEGTSPPMQVEPQLEAEKAALLERKRQEQAERQRTQEELTSILEENRRKVILASSQSLRCACVLCARALEQQRSAWQVLLSTAMLSKSCAVLLLGTKFLL